MAGDGKSRRSGPRDHTIIGLGIGTALGVGIGAALGTALGSVAMVTIGVVAGLSMGVAIGDALDRRARPTGIDTDQVQGIIEDTTGQPGDEQ